MSEESRDGQPELSARTIKNRRMIFWIVFVLALILDQVVKWHARTVLDAEHHTIVLIPKVLNYTLIYNEGIAFGFLQRAGLILAPVAIIIAGLSAAYSYRHPRETPITHVAMGLLASGALGNLYDRVFLHHVTDMFEIRLFDFPVFNIADSCITIAATILILKWAREAVAAKPEGDEPVGNSPQEPMAQSTSETLSR